MSDHDPLCPKARWSKATHTYCQCQLIREVEDRIVQGIEAIDNWEWALAGQYSKTMAIKIVRSGGMDV